MTKNTEKPPYEEIGKHFTAYSTYQKILKFNYMFHKDMSYKLAEFIKKNYSNQAFDFLDIGSGDATFVSKILDGTKIKSYTAIDVSSEALKLAKANLAKINCQKKFLTLDVSKDIPKPENKFDIIWSSYMLHHLSQKEKELFFRQCLSLLKENSFFILVDLVNNYNTREECLTNLRDYWIDKWMNLDKADIDFLVDHVYSSDYPESVEKFFEIAKGTGFSTSKLEHKIDHYAFMVFEN